MMALPSELTLDCNPQNYSFLLKSFGDQPDQQTQKLEEYLARLEEERLKIDAFKRELPLCMQLLTYAVEVSRQQLQSYRASQVSRPVLEEFIPLKLSNSDGIDQKSSINCSDKTNWMTSAQLWSPVSDGNKQEMCPKEADIGFAVNPKLALDTKQRNEGAFLPFAKERKVGPGPSIRALPDLALASSDQVGIEEKKCSEMENGVVGSRSDISVKEGSGGGGKGRDAQTTTASTVAAHASPTITTTAAATTNQTHRKARRCWSPDLHRRFVSALQMLGGSQVATPKQIRELMKVDGLTNDEVKSHLQKYRLHTRRPSPSPQAAGAPGPQLVVLGGIWVPPEYATAAAAAHGGAPTIYGAHPTSQVPPHYCPSPLPQEFYTQAPPHQAQLHHHHAAVHNQPHMYKTPSHSHNSPESDLRGAGDRSESIEDGKCDSSSWKGDSGGVMNKLAAVRDGDEESNGSEITLKF
ncbi:hypothetical protein Nepgr_006322 [Nepenthes gracilis]|uniref:HTH myb-type domain-containing protein n=1 Tax=Nepenthes gracilis TaxID=150966 RepID=A0AAD3XH97_NEPGR|nr:hypothetical protein Nepgr_006322 [Nepenthes gracilis]